MSLEYAFRPIDDPEKGLEADKKAIELAKEYSKEGKFAKVLEVLAESPHVRALYEREKENIDVSFTERVSASYAKLRYTIEELITTLLSEEFRTKGRDLERAYEVIKEIRKFNPKLHLMTSLRTFIPLYKSSKGLKKLVFVYRASQAAFRLGNTDLAIKMLEEATSASSHPMTYVLNEFRAFLYRFRGELPKEAEALERAILVNPVRTNNRHRLAYLYEKLGKPKHAERARYAANEGMFVPLAAYAASEALYKTKSRDFVPATEHMRFNLALTAIISKPEEF